MEGGGVQLPAAVQQLAVQLSTLVCHCKSKTPAQALLALLAAFGLGALSAFLASTAGGRKSKRRRRRRRLQQEQQEKDEDDDEGEEDSDDDEEEEDSDDEDEALVGGNGGLRDFSLLSAPFKMVLCVNMELQMGKGPCPCLCPPSHSRIDRKTWSSSRAPSRLRSDPPIDRLID